MRGRQPWELLLMRRPGGADFAPGAFVFPGGTVHRDDAEWEDQVAAAAIRELFEEMGILLARRAGRFARDRECDQLRAALAGGATFGDALRGCDLAPAFDRLAFFARWITPAILRRRFDAKFFLARLPAGQTVTAQEGEVVSWLWVTPERALTGPDITLVYVTRQVLESVATGEDAARLIARARRRRRVEVVEPRMVQTDAGWEVVR